MLRAVVVMVLRCLHRKGLLPALTTAPTPLIGLKNIIQGLHTSSPESKMSRGRGGMKRVSRSKRLNTFQTTKGRLKRFGGPVSGN